MAYGRNRVIYQSEALFVGPTPSTGVQTGDGTRTDRGGWNTIRQLHRIQTANYSFNIDRTDVNQFGELAAIDRVNLDTPTVSLDFSYLLSNLGNEQNLGFVIDGSNTCVKNIIDKNQDDKNYFIRTSKEGVDAIGDSTTANHPTDWASSTIGIGNGFISSYSTEAAVGGFPTCSVNVEALNMTFQNDVSGDNPAINPVDGTRLTSDAFDFQLPTATGSVDTGDLMVSVLRPGDITFSFTKREAESQHVGDDLGTDLYDAPGAKLGDGTNTEHAKIQSYSISVDMPREPILKLGSRYAFTREITFPVTATMSIDALVADLEEGSLNDLVNCDEAYDLQVNLLRPTNCAGASNKDIFVQYRLKNAKVNAQSFSSDIGSNKSVTFEFSAQIGGPNQSNQGLYMSGIAPASLGLAQDASAQQ